MTFKNFQILISVLFLFLASCGSKKEEKTQEDAPKNHLVILSQAQFKNAGISFGKPQVKNLPGFVEATGILDVPPQNLVNVSAMMAGFVKSTKLLQGQHVHKGEVLVVLQNQEFITMQQEYLSNKSKLEFLETETRRQKELSAENVSSAKVYQQSNSELQTLKAGQSGLHKKLQIMGFQMAQLEKGQIQSELSVICPIDGYVTEVKVNVGKYVQPNDLICEIVDMSHLHAELAVFEKDVPKLKIGQKIEFRLAGNLTKTYQAEIYLINKKINPDKTVRVHGHLESDIPELLPNMSIKASIEVENNMAQVVPNEAIVSFGREKFVFVSKGKDAKGNFQFEKILVKTGIQGATETEILEPADLSGIQNELVVKGAHDLLAVLENGGEEE
jgi:cobalt-zinc-cadmium efflux system membrane fusion protein